MRGFFGLLFGLLLVSFAAGQSPPTKASPVEEPPLYFDLSTDESDAKFLARLPAALDRLAVTNYVETPLQEVAADFAKLLELPVELDVLGLVEVGVNGDTPVTKSVAGLKARGALKILLLDHGVTFYPRHGRLLFTCRDAVKPAVRLYPVADLLPKHRSRRGEGERDSDTLIQMITSVIAPSAWEVGGPPIDTAAQGAALSVTLPYDAHCELERFLKALRLAHKTRRENPAAFPANGFDATETDAMRKKLDPIGDFEFKGNLGQFAASLADKLKVPVFLSTLGLDEVGKSSQTEIKGDFRQVSFRQGIRALLRPLDLALVVTAEGLEITNPDRANHSQMQSLRIFHAPPELDIDSSEIIAATGARHWSDTGGPGTLVIDTDLQLLIVRTSDEIMEEVAAWLAAVRKIDAWARRLPEPAALEYVERLFPITRPERRELPATETKRAETITSLVDAPPEEMRQLADFVRRNVAPDSWGKEARLDVWRGQLLVRQKAAVIREIETLLRDLGATPSYPRRADGR